MLVMGLGNSILGDDGVGPRVVARVQEWLLSRPQREQDHVEVDSMAVGGLRLMERLVGYERVILVDAISAGPLPPGTVSCYSLEDMPDPSDGHSASAHDVSLLTALRLGRELGVALPRHVMVVTIAAHAIYDFTESLTAPVAEALPLAVNRVLEALAAGGGLEQVCKEGPPHGVT